MQELLRQALAFLRGMWNFRWQGLIASWVVALIGVVVVFRIPDQYEASARIYVDTQSILKPLMSGLTVQPNVEQQISMLSRTLISRPNIEKLIRMADLDLQEGSAVEQEDLIQRLTKDIQIRNTGRDNLYSLVYRDQQSERAKRVIQSLVSIFVESSLGASRKDTDSAKTFLNEQIKQYEQKLEEAEARLKEFKLRNIDMQPDDGKSATTRLSEASAALQQAQLELREAENARDAVKAQLADEMRNAQAAVGQGGSDDAALGVSTPELDARIDAQKRNLDNLEQRYTDQHPEVIITKRQIRELEEQKKKELAELRKAAKAAAASNPSGSGNVAVQELGRMLAAAEVQVASLRTRVGEYQGRLGQARAGLKTAPQIEAEAAQLNRDYDVYRKNYQDLVARRQSAIMSGELEVASGVADFRLIDPPRVAPEPVAPNRLLLMLAALGAALAAGLATAFAGSQLRPVYNDATELRTKTGLPLLGVVSLVMSDDDRRRERKMTLRFVGASGGLVGLFVLGIVAVALLAQRAAG
ncbi:chain length-determining protein [Rubrivivax gelatinosus]|uniref:Chain length-determining protein n=1 Tax=Rubrivivax gelatinosus TaxID=28068 RepID=A0ABS1DXT5_RUBGE|nr:XrtA system polysaccharide chain length determinant [Rubrivivax gelatinosus]MBK1612252.1 chain length-determining protein [Rubrivivax gelatinosus]MBK1714318.1 chain length-determining protein [Rubrivivax gelatinosus]